MPGQQLDADHFIDNPEEIPTDSESLYALIEGSADKGGGKTGDQADGHDDKSGADAKAGDEQQGATESDEQSNNGASDGADDKGKAGTESQGKGADEQEAPILSKDGKHTIPYAVLATERERRQAAERVAQEMQQKVAQFQSQLASGAAAGQGGQVTEQSGDGQTSDLMSDEDLAQMVKDFPAIQRLVDQTRRLQETVRTFDARFRETEERESARRAQELSRHREQIRAAVDANPTLTFWEQNDQEKWKAAIEADERLAQLPANQGLSLDERFAKAVTIVETIYGPTELPPEWAAKKLEAKADVKKGGESTESVSRKAAEAVEKAGEFRPRTLSEMPGGAAPGTDPLDDLASQSAARIGAQFESMTPDQISAILARAG